MKRRIARVGLDEVLALPAGEIHLWLAFQDEIDDGSLCERYRGLLDATERTREQRFHFARDRHRYLVTRALVRTVLSRYAPVAPDAWQFVANAYGRPEIAPVAQDWGLSFNLSHTRGLIVLAVTRQRALGVDVENTALRAAPLDVANRFFAPAEVAALSTVPSALQPQRFFEYWTFKESYIKARGMGLSLPLDGFSFHYPHDRGVSLDIQSRLQDQPWRWRFWQFRPTPQHLVAICAERDSTGSQVFAMRKVIPLQDEVRLDPVFLRTSE